MLLMSREEVVAKIASGAALHLAGDEALLRGLPRGRWIGGTIPYFMASSGGLKTREKILVKEHSSAISEVSIRSYGVAELPRIVADAPANGFSVVIIPGMSEAHARYAQDAPDYDGLFLHPIVGWIAGIDLDDLGMATPKVFDGSTGQVLENEAVVLHATLPADRVATIGILNLFKQSDGDSIRFEQEGFSVGECLVNGERRSLAEYLTDAGIDTRLPLVADYHGEMINVGIQTVDAEAKRVDLYAPVFAGIEYRMAVPVPDYVEAFEARIPQEALFPEFSCNCVLNFLYSELEGKQTGQLTGPVTFGEIAYHLLNQTLVYLEVREI